MSLSTGSKNGLHNDPAWQEKHDWYQIPVTKVSQPVPRYTKINDILANHIMKMLKTWVKLTKTILLLVMGMIMNKTVE